nr:hypothetical protein [uncultured Holophaga sp.]
MDGDGIPELLQRTRVPLPEPVAGSSEGLGSFFMRDSIHRWRGDTFTLAGTRLWTQDF